MSFKLPIPVIYKYLNAIFIPSTSINSHSLKIFKLDQISLHEFHSLIDLFVTWLQNAIRKSFCFSNIAITFVVFKASLANITVILACLH